VEVIQEKGLCSVRENVSVLCCVRHRHMKENSLRGVSSRRGVTRGMGRGFEGLSGAPSPLYAYKM